MNIKAAASLTVSLKWFFPLEETDQGWRLLLLIIVYTDFLHVLSSVIVCFFLYVVNEIVYFFV